jgi:hypothetical protein
MNNPPQPAPPRKQPPNKPVDPALYSFDIGLTKITTNRRQKKRMKLPKSSEIEPSVGKMEERLKAIVGLQTFESILLEVLRPDVKTRTLLIPVHFRRRLRELRDSLRKELTQKKNAKSGEEIDGLLASLDAQLNEETGRNELLDQYRLMILMG